MHMPEHDNTQIASDKDVGRLAKCRGTILIQI